MSNEEGKRFMEWVWRSVETPEIKLPMIGTVWKNTGNPFFVWVAIAWCAKLKCDLPDWVLDYLNGCATRMLSKEARQSNDFRKILPRVMGFPKKHGRGAHPLRQDLEPGCDKQFKKAVWAFGMEIFKGAKPAAALRDAANALPSKLSETDDKTLRRQIKMEFGVTNSPRTNAEWQHALTGFYFAKYAPLVHVYQQRDTLSDDDVKSKIRDFLVKE